MSNVDINLNIPTIVVYLFYALVVLLFLYYYKNQKESDKVTMLSRCPKCGNNVFDITDNKYTNNANITISSHVLVKCSICNYKIKRVFDYNNNGKVKHDKFIKRISQFTKKPIKENLI